MLRNFVLLNFLAKSKSNIRPATRSYVRRVKEPGIRRRLAQFSEDFAESDPDTMESLEPDFMNVHEAHKQFENEEQKFRQTVPQWIVGRKYFKEKTTNFLFWAEKEQIRNLHEKDSREWTAEKLSESFPADPTTIRKLIRNKWHPANEMRVYNHDEAVLKNWQNYKKGELEVDPLLDEHLKKFSQRDFVHFKKPTTNKNLGTEVPKPRSTEFQDIVKSCKKYADPVEPPKRNVLQLESSGLKFPDRPKDPEKDSVILRGAKATTMKNMPLSEYQKLSTGIVLEEETPPSAVAQEAFKFKVAKTQEPNVTSLQVEDKIYERLRIQDRITIPQKAWKRDQTYKVGDCFYDDDGEFLFRVPGLK